MPAAFWVPGSWYWDKIATAIDGGKDREGRKYSVTQAFLSSIGIKVRSVDVEGGLGFQAYEFKKVQDSLRQQMRRLGHDRERNLISEAEFNREIAALTEKFATLEANWKDFSERAQKKSK